MGKKKSKVEVGSTQKYRIITNDESKSYITMKCVDTKSVSVLPRCLVSTFGTHSSLLSADEIYEGIVIEILENCLPVISIQTELLALKSCFTKVEGDLTSGQTMVGIVNGIQGSRSTLSVKFMGGSSRQIKVKDLNNISNYSKVYRPGNVIRVAVNKLGRLCTKEKVVEACCKETANDKNKMTQALADLMAQCHIGEHI